MVTIRVWNYGDELYGIGVKANLGFGLLVTAVFDVTMIPWPKTGVTIVPCPNIAVTTILLTQLVSKLSP